ncbi:MAG: 3D-(3,5/4)-trihydroxycyclohexane-1,2-dione acylhydrolase (decyclizing) [Actinomycetes bacterium]
MTEQVRLTVAQALVRFLAKQWTERDGERTRLFAGCLGIFGHGNVAGIGQALLAAGGTLPYVLARNEQAMVHTAVGYARMADRLSTYACTTSIGPGATNLVTGAALATVNRLPVLLLPGDVFATRVANPVLQELEDARSYEISVNDCLAPVSKFFARINRAEQLVPAALAAVRVLIDPAETGAVTLALPQDVQAEAWDFPAEFVAERVWRIRRPPPEPEALDVAATLIRSAGRPLLVAGGGVIYAGATEELRELAEATGIPVAETQAGKGSLRFDHPATVGAIGATGTTAANTLARNADVVIGVGTRWSDFTTASRSLFAGAGVRFVNLNVAASDAYKLAGHALVADAKVGLAALAGELTGWSVEAGYADQARQLAADWQRTVDAAFQAGHGPLPSQPEVIGAVNEIAGPRDVVVCAAGSMPGDLHKLWRTRDPKGYHVEYGYSCMGYEIAGGIGVKLAAPDREVFVLVGDGSYLMLAQELVTAAQEHAKIIVVLVENQGFASIGALSESVGNGRFGTQYLSRNPDTGALDGPPVEVDLAANAASLGAEVMSVSGIAELREALRAAVRANRTTVVHVRTDPLVAAPSSQAWWDVPVAAVSSRAATQAARAAYENDKKAQRTYL